MTENPNPQGPPVKELSGRIGKYDIVKPLGKGAMGIVYLAHDTVLERDVALKVMVAQIADDPELKARFEREAKAVAKMTHPNVVNVFDLGNHSDGSPFIAMELLKGQDLQKAMRTPGELNLERQVLIIVQVLAGLAHAHDAGIVHRDIKPANIFINHDGTVKIMDFGVARLTSASMTGTGNIVGTADYMSPEQVKGARVDGRSDLFSVGCMLYELIAGKRPFHSDNLMAIFYKITHEEPDFSLIPQGPEYEALMPVLEKALAKNLDDRYQTAFDFASDLREYVKLYATSRSGAHQLEELLAQAPRARVEPMDDPSGPTVVDAGADMGGATMDVGPTRPGTSPGGRSATLKGGAPTAIGRPGTGTAMRPTVIAPSAPGTRGGTMRAPGAPSLPPTVARRGGPVPESGGASPLVWVAVALGVIGVGGVGYLVFKKPPEEKVAVVTPTAPTSAPTTAPTAVPTVATAQPIETLGEVHGKAAGLLKTAHTAMTKGDYDRAIEQAQAALREEPNNAQAQQIVDNALKGQKASGIFRDAQDALRKGDFVEAERLADAGRAQAPWDSRGPELLNRIRDAQQRAQQQEESQKQAQQREQQAAKQTQINGYLNKAASEIGADRYDAAIALYDEVLKIDPQNQTAMSGKTNAVVAKKMSEAAANASKGGGGSGPARSFASGKTSGQGMEARGGGNVPEGFEDTAGVTVKRGSQAADLPGKISFDIDPASIKPGDKYTVKIQFANEGTASIQLNDLTVTTIVDGRKMSGPVPVTVKEIAPHGKETILTLTDFWKEVQSWSMEVAVRTARGETYKNQVTWR